tara:strand:- start:574 stop:2247 length:1674 start_codon:yes stop_codon:yes gene_type:complete
MILMLKNIDSLNNTVRAVFIEYGIDCEVNFLYSQYPDRSDLQCNELLKHKNLDSLNNLTKQIKKSLLKLDEVGECEIEKDLFINITLSNKFLEKFINHWSLNTENFYQSLKERKSKKILIDYGGPNIGKALHVGHLRSLSIGRSLYKMNELVGNSVLSDIHLGDWGMPVAYMIALIEKDKVDLDNISYTELEEIYPRSVKYAEEDDDFYKEAKRVALELNKESERYMQYWNQISSISIQYIKTTLEAIDHSFDLWKGESTVNKIIPPMIEELIKEKKVIENDGAKVANINIDPPILIEKSDGSSLYMTTDLATLVEREEEGFDEIIYVVDNRQKNHFKQLFECVNYFSFSEAKLIHVGFGTINGEDGKPLKTRDGDVYKLDKLFNDVSRKLSTKETPEESAGKLINNILTFSDLVSNRNTDYKFDIEKFTDTNGKTAIYLDYTYARGTKVCEDLQEINKEKEEYTNISITNSIERELVITALKFKYFLDMSVLNNEPHHVANYTYDLARKINVLYEDQKLTELPWEEASPKLILLKISLLVLKTGMESMGITPVGKI